MRIKQIAQWMSLGLGLSFTVACGGMYNADVSEAEVPTASISFAGHDTDFPTGTYFLDVAGSYANGTATGSCTTAFSGCFSINPAPGATAGESTSAAMTGLCSGDWDFTDSAGTGEIKLRDTANAGACDTNIPHIAECIMNGTYTAATAAATPVDSATALTPGYRVRVRPNGNFVRLTCTLTNADITFDIGIQ